jgi:hypothetical protein
MEHCGIIKFHYSMAADESISAVQQLFRVENKNGTPGIVFMCSCINGSIDMDEQEDHMARYKGYIPAEADTLCIYIMLINTPGVGPAEQGGIVDK